MLILHIVNYLVNCYSLEAGGSSTSIPQKIDENVINNMPGSYILDKVNDQNEMSFRHYNVIFGCVTL